MADTPLKSSYELALERLRQKDALAGIEHVPSTDAQKVSIAEIRNFYDAKMAEQEVLYQSRARQATDPAARQALDDSYRRDRERLASDRDAKIEKIRNAG